MNVSKVSSQKLWAILAKERAMTSLIEKELAPATTPFERNKENWVRAWLDHGNSFVCGTGEHLAIRAITDHGELFWYVKSRSRRLGYHSDHDTPEGAIEDARVAAKRRRAVRHNWEFVRRLRRDLMLGRSKLDVRIQDAYDSPLCTLGVKAFMRRIGLGRCQGVSGFVAGFMACLDEQVGFVIYQAWLRQRDSAEQADQPFDTIAETKSADT